MIMIYFMMLMLRGLLVFAEPFVVLIGRLLLMSILRIMVLSSAGLMRLRVTDTTWSNLEGNADMWFFIITDDGFQVFEILPDCVKPSCMFHATSLKASLDGVLSHVRAAYSGMDVSVDIDNATFDTDNAMIGMVRVVLV
nr:MAG TPA: hypothetical protein [Caudoviricetes sp.]